MGGGAMGRFGGRGGAASQMPPSAAPPFSGAISPALADSGVPRAIIPPISEIGVGSGVGSDAGFDLTAAPLRPGEQRFPFGPGAAFGPAAAPAQDSAASWAGHRAAPNSHPPSRLPLPHPTTDVNPLPP